MKIHILLLGKNKDRFTDEAVSDFERKIKPFCELQISYLKDETIHDDIGKILQVESRRVLEQIKPSDFLIILDDKGKTFDSLVFADEIQGLMNRGHSSLVFVVGSTHGLADELKEKAHLRLSLSALTMSHQIVRLVLLEQLYRAFTILRGMKYHK